MVNFKKLTEQAKDLVEKRGGTGALKGDAEELKEIAGSKGSLADKAKDAAAALKDPGADETEEQPTPDARPFGPGRRARGARRSSCRRRDRRARARPRPPRQAPWRAAAGEAAAAAYRRISAMPPAGLEPAARCLEGSRSIQLSYGGVGSRIRRVEAVAPYRALRLPLVRANCMAICADEFALRDLGQNKGLASVVERRNISRLLRAGKVVPLHRCMMEHLTAVAARLAGLELHEPGRRSRTLLTVVGDQLLAISLVVRGRILSLAPPAPRLQAVAMAMKFRGREYEPATSALLHVLTISRRTDVRVWRAPTGTRDRSRRITPP